MLHSIVFTFGNLVPSKWSFIGKLLVKIIGKEFNHVIEINYDLESFRAECIEKRASLDRRIKEAKTISAMILLEPRKDRIVFKHNNVMDAQIEELLLDEELSQTAREEKTLKIKFNNERAILTEYFKLVDAYDESVGKKNKAIVSLLFLIWSSDLVVY